MVFCGVEIVVEENGQNDVGDCREDQYRKPTAVEQSCDVALRMTGFIVHDR